jgi:DNA-binding Lrp family transcriptional regulator
MAGAMETNSSERDIDAIDRKILQLLQADATLSNATLGEQLSLSTTPCWRRRKRLEEEGYIIDYQANLNRRKLGYQILAFVSVRFSVHSDQAADNFESIIRLRPEVLSCHKITGGADYLLQIVAKDLDSYGEFVERILRKQRGIAEIQSSLALREIKATTRLEVPQE